MGKIGAFEARNTWGSLLDQVEEGEEILITRHRKSVARLLPNAKPVDNDQVSAALKRIRDRSSQLKVKFD